MLSAWQNPGLCTYLQVDHRENGWCNHPPFSKAYLGTRITMAPHSGGRPKTRRRSVNYFVIPIASFGTRHSPCPRMTN